MGIAKSNAKSFEIKPRNLETEKPKPVVKDQPKIEPLKTATADETVFKNKLAGLKTEASYQKLKLTRSLNAADDISTDNTRTVRFSRVDGATKATYEQIMTAATEVSTAQDRVEAAQTAVAEIEAQFNSDLLELGPMLTDAQREQFIRDFRAEHAEVYQEYDAAIAALEESLKTHRGVLVEGAVNHPMVAETLFDALATNAATGDPQFTLEFTNQLLAAGQYEVGWHLFGEQNAQEIFDKILQPAMLRAPADALLEADGDVDRAVNIYISNLGNLVSVTDLLASLNADKTFDLEAYSDYLTEISKAQPADAARLAAEGESLGRVGTMFAAAGLFFNFSAAGNTEGWQQIDHLASGTQAVLELLPGVLSAAQRYGMLGDDALRAGAIASRLAPVVGIVANFAALMAHGQDMRNNPNAGLFMAIVGDTTALVGSFFASFPVTAPIGVPLAAVGTLISATGEILSSFIRRDENILRKQQLLENLGIPTDAARVLASSSGDRIRELQTLGLSAEQIQTLAGQYQAGFFDGFGALDGFYTFAQTFGLTGNEIFGLLNAVGNVSDAPEAVLSEILEQISAFTFSSDPYSTTEWIGILNDLADEYGQRAANLNNPHYAEVSAGLRAILAQLESAQYTPDN